MATGACGINCDTCKLYRHGECSSCGPAMSETAQMKMQAQERLLGSPCPLLACARLNRINHCLADCDNFPCENLERGPYPFSAAFLSMQQRRRQDMKSPKARREEVRLSREHWEKILACSPTSVAQAASVKWEGDRVELQIFNRQIVVSLSREQVELVEGDTRCQATGLMSLVALTYLYYTKGSSLAGQWVSEKDLSFASFFRGIHQLPLALLLERFGTEPELFLEAARKLGGSATKDGGDCSVLLWVLPKVPVKLILWCRDEELPAAITVLFDRSVEHFLPADGIFAMISLLQEEMLLAI